jgi:hypothetical protein
MKIRAISRRLGKWVSVGIYAVLVYLSQSAAESVTIENILDLTVFGHCNINLKKFGEDQRTVDLTEKIILVQQKLRKEYALITIDNATRMAPMVSPSVSLFEECVLHVIVGIIAYDEYRLDMFLSSSNYTYSLTPFSTYILIPFSFQMNAHVRFPHLTVLLLPVRVFYLLVPTLPDDNVDLYTRPYILVCAHCHWSNFLNKMAVNSDLAYISSLNFSSSWLKNDVQIEDQYYEDTYDITGCDQVPWSDIAEPVGSSRRSLCNDLFAFMDVLVRSGDPNSTLSLRNQGDPSDKRFSGHLNKRYLSEPYFDDAASAWFVNVAIGKLHFCDCNPKSRDEMLQAWVKPFGRSVWLGLGITFILLSLAIGTKLRLDMGCVKKKRTNDFTVSFMVVAGICLRQEGASIGNRYLLLLSSFCMGVVLSLYENSVTSELVVPPPKFEHNLSSLLMVAGSKVIYTGQGSTTNSDLMELELEAQKWNIRYSMDQFQMNNDLAVRGLPIENGTSLSYFAFVSALESKYRLYEFKHRYNKCHCYIVKHEFRQREVYMFFELFLRHRLASISNILQANGIVSFFFEKHRRFAYSRFIIELTLGLQKQKHHSRFYVREETMMDLIELNNLLFILVIFGSMVFLAVSIFTFNQIDWVTLFFYCKSSVSKYLHAIRTVNYVRLANHIFINGLVRRVLKAGAIGKSISRVCSRKV